MGSTDERPVVLIIEDEPAAIRLLEEAFDETEVPARRVVATDGVEAFDVFKNRGEYADVPLPSLVVLDLGLPNKSGRQVLEEMRADAELRHVPVIVLSNSDDPEDVLASYTHGANAYVTKPDEYEGVLEVARLIREFWFTLARLPDATE